VQLLLSIFQWRQWNRLRSSSNRCRCNSIVELAVSPYGGVGGGKLDFPSIKREWRTGACCLRALANLLRNAVSLWPGWLFRSRVGGALEGAQGS